MLLRVLHGITFHGAQIRHTNTVVTEQHGQCDTASPLDGTLAHNDSSPCHFIGKYDRYRAETIRTKENPIQ